MQSLPRKRNQPSLFLPAKASLTQVVSAAGSLPSQNVNFTWDTPCTKYASSTMIICILGSAMTHRISLHIWPKHWADGYTVTKGIILCVFWCELWTRLHPVCLFQSHLVSRPWLCRWEWWSLWIVIHPTSRRERHTSARSPGTPLQHTHTHFSENSDTDSDSNPLLHLLISYSLFLWVINHMVYILIYNVSSNKMRELNINKKYIQHYVYDFNKSPHCWN